MAIDIFKFPLVCLIVFGFPSLIILLKNGCCKPAAKQTFATWKPVIPGTPSSTVRVVLVWLGYVGIGMAVKLGYNQQVGTLQP